MAAVPPPIMVPPDGVPAVAVMPQLPHGADPGTITGWILQATSTETSESIARGLELGFNHLMDNVPAVGDASYEEVM